MDKVKSTYLLVAVNVAVLLAAAIFIVMSVGKKKLDVDDGGKTSPDAFGERGPTVDKRGYPEAVGPGEASKAPRDGIEIRTVRPPNLRVGDSLLPVVEEMPEDTLEKVRETQWLLKNLVLGCELYKSRHGKYPPSSIDESNDVNEGVEALFAHLHS
jgi:hypothetical protein